MYVTGGNNRFLKLISKFYDFLIKFNQILIGFHTIIFFICDHKCIISKWLNFQIIIKIDQSGNFRFRCISKKCLIQFASFTGTSDQKSLSVFQKKALRYTWTTSVIFQMWLADQFIEIHTSGLISRQNDRMICRQLLNCIHRYISLLVQRIHIKNVSFF